MIRLALIGIGTGNPDHLTRAAERAMATADLILLPRKGERAADLIDLRRLICADLPAAVRIAEFDVPARAGSPDYLGDVDAWHAAIADAWRAEIARHLPGGGTTAFTAAFTVALLVWGDPALYDSSLRIAARLRAGGLPIEVDVVPGITSLQALTAAHAIPLNTLAAPFAVTTGRRLRQEGWPAGMDTIVVMLDAGGAFATIPPEGIAIWWGAYLGLPQEALMHGPLADVGPAIVERRSVLRARHGWIMDTYLMRREGQHAGR